MLVEHLHVKELALGVERDQQVHRHAGKARQRHEVDRFEDIADQFGRRHLLFQDGPDR